MPATTSSHRVPTHRFLAITSSGECVPGNAHAVDAPRQHQGWRRVSCYPEGCAAPGDVQCQCNTQGPLSKLERTPSRRKINVTSKSPVGDISVVTLIRTDTTLDHSQKAEKVCCEVPWFLLQDSFLSILGESKTLPMGEKTHGGGTRSPHRGFCTLF